MSLDIFTRLSQRVLNAEEAVVRPSVPSRFAYEAIPGPDSNNFPIENDRNEELAITAKKTTETVGPLNTQNDTSLEMPSSREHTLSGETVQDSFLSVNAEKEIIERVKETPFDRKESIPPDHVIPVENDQDEPQPLSKEYRGTTVNNQFTFKINRKEQVDHHDSQLLVPMSSPGVTDQYEASFDQKDSREGERGIRPNEKSISQFTHDQLSSHPEQNDQGYPFKYNRKASKENQTAKTPTIRVTIGRIDVRAVTPPQPASHPAPKQSAPSLSLNDYLKQRNEGRR